MAAGCGAAADIDDTYGVRRGASGGASVNGTGVLAEMFEAAGHRVFTVQRLSPKLERFNVIVWAPDNFRPPTAAQRDFLERWLAEGHRTLVYIGRDYDAAVVYWEKMAAGAPQDQATEIKRRWAVQQSEHDAARRAMPEEEDVGWFLARREGRRERMRKLEGPWSDGIDGEKAEIQLEGRLDLAAYSASPQGDEDESEDETPTPFDVSALLTSDGIDFIVNRVTRAHWDDSQILVVANGSFLLNLPLVNTEHRKLAGRLIDECAPPGRTAFLESGPSGPPISEHDSAGNPMLQAFAVWPSNCILLHLTLAGIVFCFSVFPIFGRPREISASTESDFGKHVSAVGSLLRKSGAESYAQQRLSQYHNTYLRERGHSPLLTAHQMPAASTSDSPPTAADLSTESKTSTPVRQEKL